MHDSGTSGTNHYSPRYLGRLATWYLECGAEHLTCPNVIRDGLIEADQSRCQSSNQQFVAAA